MTGRKEEEAMRKTITRTIPTTTIYSGIVKMVNGVPTVTMNDPITANGEIDENKALKLVRKAYDQKSIVTEVVVAENLYEISVEDFLKYATLVPPSEKEAEAEKEAEKKTKPATK